MYRINGLLQSLILQESESELDPFLRTMLSKPDVNVNTPLPNLFFTGSSVSSYDLVDETMLHFMVKSGNSVGLTALLEIPAVKATHVGCGLLITNSKSPADSQLSKGAYLCAYMCVRVTP